MDSILLQGCAKCVGFLWSAQKILPQHFVTVFAVYDMYPLCYLICVYMKCRLRKSVLLRFLIFWGINLTVRYDFTVLSRGSCSILFLKMLTFILITGPLFYNLYIYNYSFSSVLNVGLAAVITV